jgi:hypothetical protein
MMSVSLDGRIEGPDRELDRHLVDDELHTHFNQELSEMGAFLDGRVTHELMAGFWPTADTNSSQTRVSLRLAETRLRQRGRPPALPAPGELGLARCRCSSIGF